MSVEIIHLVELTRVGNAVELEAVEDYLDRKKKELNEIRKINVEDLPLSCLCERRMNVN